MSNKKNQIIKNQFICSGFLRLKNNKLEELCAECDHSKPHEKRITKEELNSIFGIKNKITSSSISEQAQLLEDDLLESAQEAAEYLELDVEDILPPKNEIKEKINEIFEPCTKLRICNPTGKDDLESKKYELKVKCVKIK